MKINRQFVQEVANGKYSDYDLHGEMKMAAQKILDKKVVRKFQRHCFFTNGRNMPNHITDIFDAFVDFSLSGAEISIEIPSFGRVTVFGMTADESLEELYYEACCDSKLFDALKGVRFKIRGEKGLFEMKDWVCHYTFVKGYMSVREAVNECRVA